MEVFCPNLELSKAVKRFCDNICRFRMGPKWVSVLLPMDGSFLPFLSKRVLSPFSPTPIRVTERPLLKHRNFSVIIGGTGGPMTKGGTKSTQCYGNSVGDASASLRTNDRSFWTVLIISDLYIVLFFLTGHCVSCENHSIDYLKTTDISSWLQDPSVLLNAFFLITYNYLIIWTSCHRPKKWRTWW